MPQLERFFNPQVRVFDLNVKSLPGAKLNFYAAGSSTRKVIYADKDGQTSHENPVTANPSGSFPPIFLDGLYRVDLTDAAGIVQPGWPIDNVGQDNPVVPYSNWAETITYAQFERVTDPLTGIAYRSKIANNLGNVPASSPSAWEVIADTVAASFTSNASYLSWADSGGQISLNVDAGGLIEFIGENLVNIDPVPKFNSGKIQIGADSGAKSFFRFDGKISSDDSTYNDIAITEANQTLATAGVGITSLIVNYKRIGGSVIGSFSASLTGSAGALIFTIPIGYRPSSVNYCCAARTNYAGLTTTTASGILINPSGEFRFIFESPTTGDIFGSFNILL